jgi:hypothetical protein
VRIAAVGAVCIFLSGCAAPVIGGLSLGTLGMIVDTVSTIFTGKSVEEHAVGWVLGKNCNLTEGILRKARKICEERDSVEANKDFTGFFPAFGGSGVAPLERYARALGLERAHAPEYPSGIPRRGEHPHLVRIGPDVVYSMAPIYELQDVQAGRVPQVPGTMVPIYDAQDIAQRRGQLVVPPDGKPYVLKAPAIRERRAHRDRGRDIPRSASR